MRRCLTGVPALVPAACIFAVLIFTVPLDAGCMDRHLAVVRFPGGHELIRVALEHETGFSLSFIHSVSKTRVTDIYQAREKEIIQTAERFRAHGAGLPSSVDEPGGLTWEKEGDEFILRMERPIKKLVVRTDKNYENRLVIGKKTINLNQWEDQALLLHIICD